MGRSTREPHHPDLESTLRISLATMSWRPRFLAMTPRDAEPGQPSAPYPALGIAVLAVVVGVGANLLLGLADIDFAQRELIGSDGYTRYVRILDLLHGRNDWFDGWIHWSNSPFGHSMHWTRALDALVIALATPLAPFLGWNDAVYWVAIASGPLSQVGVIVITIWVARHFISRQAAALAGFIVGMQPLLLGYSLIGRLDHHVFITVLSLAVLGYTLRAIDGHRSAASQSGALAAMTIWVSTEAILPVGLSIATLVIVWVIRGSSLDGTAAWAKAFTLGTLLALLIERGPGDLTAVEYDRISLPYFAVGAAGWLGVSVLRWVVRSHPHLGALPSARVASLIGSAALPIVAMVLWFPGLVQGPFADTPTLVWDIWLSKVAEAQPMWTGANPFGSILLRLTIPVGGLVCAVHLARRRTSERFVWGVTTAWLAIMIPLASISTRLASYPEALAGLPIAAVVWATIMRRAPGTSLGHIASRVSLITVAVLGHIVLSYGAIAVGNTKSRGNEITADECDITRMEPAIDESVPVDGSILANIDIGPALHVGTGREVIVTPHHRNVEGIIDAYTILVSAPDEALRRIERRGIDALVICPSADEVYLEPLLANSLYGRLLRGDPPAWLTEVDSGTSVARLFIVSS